VAQLAMTDPAAAIDFTTYAEVLAHLRHFPADRRGEVVARLGHDPRAWQAAASRWGAARDAELEEGNADLANRFGAVFARTRSRLQLQQPSLESLGPLPPAPPPAAEPSAPAPPSAPPPPPTEVELQQSTAQRGPVAPGLPSFLATPPLITTPTPLPAVVRAPSALISTVAVGPEQPAPAASLPFRPADAGVALENALAHARATQGEPRRGVVAAGGTVGIATGPTALSAPPPGCPDLTLPQYASLRVELHQRPADDATILARYGVQAGGRAALDAHWRARFEADPLLRMEFARAYAAYLAWLRNRG
jgi:hypothetical protein